MSISSQHMIAARGVARTAPVDPATYRPDIGKLAPGQGITWSLDDAQDDGTTYAAAREGLCVALEPAPGERVLDVVAGNTATALPAAGDLPFPDASFDVVISGFGAMFAPDHYRMARELLRVCRPGGRIGLACWTPQSFNSELMSIVAGYSASRPEQGGPVNWGSREYLDYLFGSSADALGAAIRTHTWRYRTPDEWLRAWTSPGQPLRRIYLTVDTERREQLSLELQALVARFNEASDGSMFVPSEYLEFLVHKSAGRA
jgi:SAM-dependent methyltransferase